MNQIEKILPPNVDRASFFRDYWGKQSFFIKSSLEELTFPIDDLKDLLTFIKVPVEDIYFIRDTSAFHFESKDGNEPLDPHSPDHGSRIMQLLDLGYTIKINNLQFYHYGVAKLAQNIAQHFQTAVTVAAFFTPPGSNCYREHRDISNSLVLQMAGTKTWMLGGFAPATCQVDTQNPMVLAPGDVLFLPRGIAHAARCTENASLHLTVRLHTPSLRAFLSRVLEQELEKEFGPASAEGDANPALIFDPIAAGAELLPMRERLVAALSSQQNFERAWAQQLNMHFFSAREFLMPSRAAFDRKMASSEITKDLRWRRIVPWFKVESLSPQKSRVFAAGHERDIDTSASHLNSILALDHGDWDTLKNRCEDISNDKLVETMQSLVEHRIIELL